MKSNAVTTLAQQAAIHALLNEQSDEEDEPTTVVKNAPQVSIPQEELIESDHFNHFVFIEPLLVLSWDNLENENDIMWIFRQLQDGITLKEGLELGLHHQWNFNKTQHIPMDSLFRLCFHEDNIISETAMNSFNNMIKCNTNWLCGSKLICEILNVLGASETLLFPCSSTRIPHNKTNCKSLIKLYITEESKKFMIFLLTTIYISYEQHTFRVGVDDSTEMKEDILVVYEILLKLNIDATIREHFFSLSARAFQSVEGLIQSIEHEEWVNRNNLYNANNTITTTNIQNNSVSNIYRSKYSESIPKHAEIRTEAEDEMYIDEEESQLSTQLQETMLASCVDTDSTDTGPVGYSLTTPITTGIAIGIDSSIVNVGDKVGSNINATTTTTTTAVAAVEVPTTPSSSYNWTGAYTAEYLQQLDKDSMSVLLLARLDVIIRDKNISLYALASLLGLWENIHIWDYIVNSILSERVLLYFPIINWNKTQNSTWVYNNRDCGNTLDVIINCIKILQDESKKSIYTINTSSTSNSSKAISLWGDENGIRGFFHLVYRYVLVMADKVDPEGVMELRRVCRSFMKQTYYSQVEETVECIKEICDIYAT